MRDKCKDCLKPGKKCIPFLMTLSTKDMLEWCRFWKEKLGWSNAVLAEKALVPKGTIDRVMSHAKNFDGSEVKLVTIRPIICALTGCTMEELEACDISHDATLDAIIEKNRYLEEDNARLKKEAVNQRAFLADQLTNKDKQIRIKDRYIAFLAIALAACLVVIIGALVVDRLNPHLGFIWRDF